MAIELERHFTPTLDDLKSPSAFILLTGKSEELYTTMITKLIKGALTIFIGKL